MLVFGGSWGNGGYGPEALGVGVLEVFPFLLEQDVLLGNVSEDQCHLCLVFGVLEDGVCGLPHWSDASTSSDQGNMLTTFC